MKLFFDTETTGLYKFGFPPEHESQPHLVQLADVQACARVYYALQDQKVTA